jgi:putative ABC transport system permease protein
LLKDNVKLAFKNINERKSRSFLTLLGICIGIMAIISLMGIGEGMKQAITGELSSLTDTIIVTTGDLSSVQYGGGRIQENNNEYLTERDLNDIQRIKGIKSMSSILTTQATIKVNGETKGITLLGIDETDMEDIFGIGLMGLESGEFIKDGKQNTCVIGYNVAHDYFDVEVGVGNRISILEKTFVVVGVYRKSSGMATETDNHVHINTRDFKRLTGIENSGSVIIRVYDVSKADSIANEIEQAINENHGNDDFASAVTMSSVIESIQQVLSIVQIVLLSIASIALVVASIGIMNTMLTSVMERTREIGIMKAIGATNRNVLFIFIIEGIIISFIGGFIGVILGFLGSRGLSAVFTGSFGAELMPIITLESIIIGITVALFVGVLSSLYPARKAAKMSPIEAVRYE